jgi:hypothetical protein
MPVSAALYLLQLFICPALYLLQFFIFSSSSILFRGISQDRFAVSVFDAFSYKRKGSGVLVGEKVY